MNVALITALCTGIPAIIAALTALVQALRARNAAAIAQGTATRANITIGKHLVEQHDAFPIQSETETPK